MEVYFTGDSSAQTANCGKKGSLERGKDTEQSRIPLFPAILISQLETLLICGCDYPFTQYVSKQIWTSTWRLPGTPLLPSTKPMFSTMYHGTLPFPYKPRPDSCKPSLHSASMEGAGAAMARNEQINGCTRLQQRGWWPEAVSVGQRHDVRVPFGVQISAEAALKR